MRAVRCCVMAVGVVCIAVGCSAAIASAAGPATVTVRVEGLTETKLPATQVTTTTEPVINDGIPADSCSGTSAIGALQVATNGHWSGPWEASFNEYLINTIDGETHEYVPGSTSYYWSFWVNDTYQNEGACDVQLNSGDRVLFFPICDEDCPPEPEPTPLEIEAPTTADTGETVPVTIKQYNIKGEPSPAAGANIEGGGVSATTESQGHATLKFTGAGTFTLKVTGSASGPPAVRTETTVCVHNGNDGNCGTQAPAGSSVASASVGGVTAGVPYKGEYALVPKLTSVIDGHTYKRGQAPRVLSGSILAHTAVTSVSLTLRREFRDRCYAFDGVSARFVHSRCGMGTPFKVASTGVFSYLLPGALQPGRYVLDIAATDAAGNYTTLARGTSRIVFYVR